MEAKKADPSKDISGGATHEPHLISGIKVQTKMCLWVFGITDLFIYLFLCSISSFILHTHSQVLPDQVCSPSLGIERDI